VVAAISVLLGRKPDMRSYTIPLTLLAGLCLAASSAYPTTWFVERDGSGDFMVIQDAVDAAAAGDTILFGVRLSRTQSSSKLTDTLRYNDLNKGVSHEQEPRT
jgi:hypothetical protein